MTGRFVRIGILLLLVLCRTGVSQTRPSAGVEQWGTFELRLKGPDTPTAFTDVRLTAQFSNGGTAIDVNGFYDGDGEYVVRFMPTKTGAWTYRTTSSVPELSAQAGSFVATPPAAANHGPVRVADTYHFAYADGTRYTPVGTTCYNWTHQPADIQAQTLASLRASPFNKVRMCVLSTSASGDPAVPFEGEGPKKWDFKHFNPAFFRAFDERVRDLRDAGIEADVILFHPYDKQRGFDHMPADADDRYVRYVVTRLAAYRNVWWSVANEYDLMDGKTEADFDRLIGVVHAADPFGHLLSIHHSRVLFDNSHPFITHASIQNGAAVEDAGRAELYRDVWRKPVVYDEVKYEGDFPRRWGQLSGEEMTRRFWNGTVAGTYVGHGEVLQSDTKRLWTSHGGVLHGTSTPRLAFLRQVLEKAPPIDPIDKWQDASWGGRAGEYYLTYFGTAAPREWAFVLPRPGLRGGEIFHVDVLDTWNMTITPVAGEFVTRKRDDYSFDTAAPGVIRLPGRPYVALRIVKTGGTPPTTAPDKVPD